LTSVTELFELDKSEAHRKAMDKDKINEKEVGDAGEEGLWHAVDFKEDCPHILTHISMVSYQNVRKSLAKVGCRECKDPRENWYCLKCAERFCGRYIKAHAQAHYQSEFHSLFLSLVDLSVWCYKCDEYVTHPFLIPFINELHMAKFGEPHPRFDGSIGFIPDADDEKGDEDEKGVNEKD